MSLGQVREVGTICTRQKSFPRKTLGLAHVCPYAITRSSPISCKFGVSSFNISWIPSRLILSAASMSSCEEPSALPKDFSISCSQYLSSRSKVGLWEQVEILMSSAKPFLICAVGSVRRKVKSKKVWIGAW